jgi:hypothetical protein
MMFELVFLAVLVYIVFRLQEKKDANGRKYVFPQGPFGLPFIGNQFQLPPFGVGPLLKQWADEYGEMSFSHSFPSNPHFFMVEIDN